MDLPVDPMNLGRMEKQMALQQELMAAISHEIRTPVARLNFALQLLQDDLQDHKKTTRRSKMLASCEAMAVDLEEINALVGEIMTYTHLEDDGPRIIFQKVDLVPLLRSLCDQYADLNPSLTIEMMAGLGDLSIDVEPVQLRRACQNLIGNAVNYAAGNIRLGFYVSDDFCVIMVEDDGPGIAEADYGRVFSPFIRLDESRSRDTGGFGLGLSIVRRIAYWHGGRAVAGRSQQLGGANMMICLPVHQPTDSLQVPSMAHLAGQSA